jgi:PhnB protein
MAVHHIPEGYHSVIPYLVVDGAAEAIEFYKNAFNATELMRMPRPDGKVAHAEIKIGGPLGLRSFPRSIRRCRGSASA